MSDFDLPASARVELGPGGRTRAAAVAAEITNMVGGGDVEAARRFADACDANVRFHEQRSGPFEVEAVRFVADRARAALNTALADRNAVAGGKR